MSHETQELVVATTNRHKVEEIRNMLGPAVSGVRGTHDWDHLEEVEETGDTFRENAEQKARGYYDQIQQPVLADDSGLCVRALDGRPGVHTARYAGPGSSDDQNNRKLLDELEGVPRERRDARFVCSIVLIVSDRLMIASHGECRGTIRTEPEGSGGFGYDPLFEPEGADRTFAQMTEDEKDQRSHRSDALQQLDVIIDSQAGELWSRPDEHPDS